MKGQEQSQSQDQTHTSLSNMTIKTFICIDKKCGIIQVDTPNLSIKYYIDFPDYNDILSNNKNLFMNDKDDYPTFIYNNNRISIFNYIYNKSNELIDKKYTFKNINSCDLRRDNVVIKHKYHDIIEQNYKIEEFINGHSKCSGRYVDVIKNPIWIVEHNSETQTSLYLMYCETDTICKLCPISYQKIMDFEKTENNNKKITWHKAPTGYIQGHMDNGKCIHIHQVIMNFYGHGRGTTKESIDHIDRNPLNNCYNNLRIASQQEQKSNSKGVLDDTKRDRKKNAKNLPEGITQDMLQKYVVYYHECYNKEKQLYREFFKIEKHPKLTKPITTTKSTKHTALEKLEMANKIVDDLKNDIYPVQAQTDTKTNSASFANLPSLPNYVSYSMARERLHLVFERRLKDKRYNLKMILPKDYNLADELVNFRGKVIAKYGNDDDIVFDI